METKYFNVSENLRVFVKESPSGVTMGFEGKGSDLEWRRFRASSSFNLPTEILQEIGLHFVNLSNQQDDKQGLDVQARGLGYAKGGLTKAIKAYREPAKWDL